MFYNAAMALDRDLGVALVTAWARAREAPLEGWDMLAATGVRGLRLAGETHRFGRMTFTEANPAAAGVLRGNVAGLVGAVPEVVERDAREADPRARFDYVDVDPYGTPVPFLPAAFAALRTGGLLAVTATDMPVLAGVQRAACEARYGARPVRGRLGPEGGLRILLGLLARTAAAEGRGIRPVLAYVLDHHVRAYVELTAHVELGGQRQIQDEEPGFPPLGPGGPFGPLWTAPIFDANLVRGLAPPASPARPPELERLLARFREEVDADVPFFYEPNRIARAEHLAEPPALGPLLAALRARGHRAARAHPQPGAFRTDAPRATVAEVARALAAPAP